MGRLKRCVPVFKSSFEWYRSQDSFVLVGFTNNEKIHSNTVQGATSHVKTLHSLPLISQLLPISPVSRDGFLYIRHTSLIGETEGVNDDKP